MYEIWMTPEAMDSLPRQEPAPGASIFSGTIGVLGGVPLFTDCALPPNGFFRGSPALHEATRGLPHTCDGTCSRARQETDDD